MSLAEERVHETALALCLAWEERGDSWSAADALGLCLPQAHALRHAVLRLELARRDASLVDLGAALLAAREREADLRATVEQQDAAAQRGVVVDVDRLDALEELAAAMLQRSAAVGLLPAAGNERVASALLRLARRNAEPLAVPPIRDTVAPPATSRSQR